MHDDLHDDGGDAMASLAFFRDHRSRLGPIVSAAVTFPGLTGDDPFTVVLRDAGGRRMLLSGAADGCSGDAPRAALQVLVEAGFAANIAQAVLTHDVVRLSRTPDGTTSLERATRLARTAGRPAGVSPTSGSLVHHDRPSTPAHVR